MYQCRDRVRTVVVKWLTLCGDAGDGLMRRAVGVPVDLEGKSAATSTVDGSVASVNETAVRYTYGGPEVLAVGRR